MAEFLAGAYVELGHTSYGFEITEDIYRRAKDEMLVFEPEAQMSIADFPDVMPSN